MTPIIEAHGLTKCFGKTEALAGLDLVAEAGRVVAILGPNGAGKTTFVRAVATLLRPDGGTLRVGGIDAVARPAEVRRLIGLAGQYAAVEPAMTGRENLDMVARLFGFGKRSARQRAEAVLGELGLADAGDRLVRTYSGGMRRRLDLGASLVGEPQLLLLDEPTTGLDPRSRMDLWDGIRRLVQAGTDVVLTTQYLEEADQLATDIVIIDHGKVIAEGTASELKSLVGDDVIEVHPRRSDDLAAVGRVLHDLTGIDPRIDVPTRRASAPAPDGAGRLVEAVSAFAESGIAIDDIGLRRPTLDEAFLVLTGQSIDGDVERVA
jgi:ABC-2 type transport system ATP-binding protein